MGIIRIFRTKIKYNGMIIRGRYIVLEDDISVAKLKLRKFLLTLDKEIEILKIEYDGIDQIIM